MFSKPTSSTKSIDLKIGDPKDAAPPELRQILARCSGHPITDRYPNKFGAPILHRAITKSYAKDHSVILDPATDMCVTTGVWPAIVAALMARLPSQGKQIAYFAPCFFGFYQIFSELGMTPVPLDLGKFAQGTLDLDQIFAAMRGGILLLNHPHNPTGYIFSTSELKNLADVARCHDVAVVSDFVYKDLYEGSKPQSFLEFDDSALEIFGMSKSYRMAGWRCGYIVGHGEWMDRVKRIRSNLDNGVCTSTQIASAYLLRRQSGLVKFRDSLNERRHVLITGLRSLEFQVNVPKAGIATNFVWAKIPFGLRSSDEAADRLNRFGVEVLSGKVCGSLGEGYLRFALNYPSEVLVTALSRIEQAVDRSIVV
jgi:aspartate/methionine/tyrosine aminotransferase